MTSTPPSPSSSFLPSPASATGTASGTTTAPASGAGTGQGTAPAPAPAPGAPPVHILSTKPARIYSLLHPLALVLLLATRFTSLVSDPVAELTGDLPFLAALQVVFVAVCLPAAGSHSHGGSGAATGGTGAGAGTGGGTGSGTEGTDEEKKKVGLGLGRSVRTAARRRAQHGKGERIWVKVVPALISLTLTTLLATPAFTILLVLFGAPLTTHNFETVLCAAHMALLAATPLVYVHGVDAGTWREVWGVARPADIVWGGALGTGVGAWFGAVPIPLDWDRPWQAYPITILTGAYLGFAVGSLICRSSWVYGRRIQFVPDEDQKAEKVE